MRLVFLYGQVLNKKIGLIQGVIRAKRSQRLPVVLTKREVKEIIDHLDGLPRLMVILLYGAGLRLMECCRLRIKDIDFSRKEILFDREKEIKTVTRCYRKQFEQFSWSIYEPLNRCTTWI